MKIIFYIFVGYFSQLYIVVAQQVPGIGGGGLPGDRFLENGESDDISVYDNVAFESMVNIITAYFIRIVAVIAVLAVMLSGILLIMSGGDEEKFKKARTWLIWSLIGVFISLTAWFMITFLNRLTIK